MSFFHWVKQNITASRWMSLTAVVLLLISVSMTVYSLRLQQELRQRAAPSCKALNAECNNNNSNKLCCSGLTCVVTNPNNGNGKCELLSTPVEPTAVPTTYSAPTSQANPTSGEIGATPEPEPGVTSAAIGTGSIPDVPAQCGPNGCGWSPRPEGEKSTNNPPGIKVCTVSFSGPQQLLGTRLSPTSIRFNWWPAPGGADNQLIQYGLESGKPQWGLINIAGDQGQIVIDHLPANKTIWAQIRAYRGNCYEDTGWVSVGPSSQARQTTSALQQTGIPTFSVTAEPTSISTDTTSYFASTTPEKPQTNRFLLFWLALLPILLVIAFIFRKFFWFLLFKRRRKKKE